MLPLCNVVLLCYKKTLIFIFEAKSIEKQKTQKNAKKQISKICRNSKLWNFLFESRKKELFRSMRWSVRERKKVLAPKKKFFVSFYFVGGDSKISSSKVQLSESAETMIIGQFLWSLVLLFWKSGHGSNMKAFVISFVIFL